MGEDWPAEKEREHTRVSKCSCKAEAVWTGDWGRGTGENKVGWGSCDGVLWREGVLECVLVGVRAAEELRRAM